jgi:hypothetical protein
MAREVCVCNHILEGAPYHLLEVEEGVVSKALCRECDTTDRSFDFDKLTTGDPGELARMKTMLDQWQIICWNCAISRVIPKTTPDGSTEWRRVSDN